MATKINDTVEFFGSNISLWNTRNNPPYFSLTKTTTSNAASANCQTTIAK